MSTLGMGEQVFPDKGARQRWTTGEIIRDKDSASRQGTLPMTGTYVVATPANLDVDKVDSMPTDFV